MIILAHTLSGATYITKPKAAFIVFMWFCMTVLVACQSAAEPINNPPGSRSPSATIPVEIDRETSIPSNAVKISPATDEHPPVVYTSDYAQPKPVPGAVNTAGAEDSPFITPDGNTLYFFFTPDLNVPVEQQLLDGVTGIYVSHKTGGEWGEAQRVRLQEPGKLSLDGCEFVQADIIWFCTTREGYAGMHWFTAHLVGGVWQDWQLADFDPAFQVGELHFFQDGRQVYFGSERPGGMGGMDIWSSSLVGGTWQAPVNISAVNTADSEGWPALNPAGDELWFYRNYSIWRSKLVEGEWQSAEMVVSPLAGEPSLDAAGNLYFVHHYLQQDKLIEADIYVAEKQ
jgi:hypothetical protein